MSMLKYSIPLFIIAVIGNILGYWVKSTVKANGYSVKYFSGHFHDTKNLFKLAKLTGDKSIKTKYLVMGFCEIGLGVAYIVFTFLVFSSFPSFIESACNSFKDFKSYKYDYLVIDKYVDSTEHSYPTLILQDAKGNKIKNQDLRMDYSGLFNLIRIGDSLKKENGDSIVNVINGGLDTMIESNFGCDMK